MPAPTKRLRTHNGPLDGRPRQKVRDERRGWPPVPARPPHSRRRSCSGPKKRTVSTRRPAPTTKLGTHNGRLDGRPRQKVRDERRGWPPVPARPPQSRRRSCSGPQKGTVSARRPAPTKGYGHTTGPWTADRVNTLGTTNVVGRRILVRHVWFRPTGAWIPVPSVDL